MYFCFADDSQQPNPSRPGMRALQAVGGIFVDARQVGSLQRELDALCRTYGFPDGAAGEFKWSPGRELWMRESLVEENRLTFFQSAVGALAEAGGSVVVVVVDVDANPATKNVHDPEEDATRMFLERASNRFKAVGEDGVVIVDRPSGGRGSENQFLAECVLHLQDDGIFVVPDRFALPVITTQSRHVRLLQLADLVTACSLAFVSGEDTHSPPVFELIRELIPQELGRRGGVGLKIHPDFRYANLCHWLLGDTDWVKGYSGVPLPRPSMRYAISATSA